MTREEIIALQPGKTMDAAVHEFVMRLPKPPPMTYRRADKEEGGFSSCSSVRRKGWVANIDWYAVGRMSLIDSDIDWVPDEEYSTDMTASWIVVEIMRERGLHLILNDTGGQYRARFFEINNWDIFSWMHAPDAEFTAWEETASLAICRAALLISLSIRK